MMIRKIEALEGLDLVMILEHTDVHYSMQSIDDFLHKKNYQCLGMFQQERLRGALIVSEGLDTVDVIQIVTHPEHRRKGIAKDLLNHLVQTTTKAIMLEVNEKNEGAIALYKRLGFEVISKRLNYYGGKQHALIMRKE